MRSAADCLSEAEKLSRIAEGADNAEIRALLLTLAETWLNIGALAEWRDAPVWLSYLIQ